MRGPTGSELGHQGATVLPQCVPSLYRIIRDETTQKCRATAHAGPAGLGRDGLNDAKMMNVVGGFASDAGGWRCEDALLGGDASCKQTIDAVIMKRTSVLQTRVVVVEEKSWRRREAYVSGETEGEWRLGWTWGSASPAVHWAVAARVDISVLLLMMDDF